MLKISYITYRVLYKDTIIEIILKIHFYLPTVTSLLPLLPLWLSGKEYTCNTGDVVLIPGSGRVPAGGHGNPLQYYCLKNPMDRGAWQAVVHVHHRVRHSWVTNAFTCVFQGLQKSKYWLHSSRSLILVPGSCFSLWNAFSCTLDEWQFVSPLITLTSAVFTDNV